MSKRTRHVRHQLPVIAALGRTVGLATRQRLLGALGRSGRGDGPVPTPGPKLSRILPPRPADLVADYLDWCGVDPARYPGTLPPHLFPQWSFPLLGRTLGALPYPLARVLNAGFRMEIHAPIPAGEPLRLEAHLESIDDDGRRALIQQRAVTQSRDGRPLLTTDVFMLVPLSRKRSDAESPRKERPAVPEGAEEIARERLGPETAFDYACLTGDFNPVHWIRPYARMAGFKSTILHGFATGALCFERLVDHVAGGDPTGIRTLEVRFTRPLVLPREVGIYVADGTVTVGDRPGEAAYLTGSFDSGELP
jgi:acyl dehydratase